MNTRIEEVVNVYKKAAQFPDLLSAEICRDDEKLLTVVSDWSQRNLERRKLTKFRRIHILRKNSLHLVQGLQDLPAADTTDELFSRVSDIGKLQAVIRYASCDANWNRKKYFLEIWQNGRLWKTLDLTALNVHGDVYGDATFGCFEWSPCERKLLYIAEKKRPRTYPFYSVGPVTEKPDDESSRTEPVKGAEYDFIEDWGEQLIGKSQSVVAVYDVAKEAPVVWDEGFPEGYCPGQVTWVPNPIAKRDVASGEWDVDEDTNGIVGIAWKSEPRRLGLVFCSSREGILFHANSSGKIRVLRGGDGGISPRSPRFSPDGSRLIWLERHISGTYDGSSRLMHCAWPPNDGTVEAEVLIDFEPKAISDGEDPFCGIFCDVLPRRPFSKDGKNIIFYSKESTAVHTFIINLETRLVSRLGLTLDGKPLQREDSSVIVLDVNNDIALFRYTCLNKPHALILASLDDGAASPISSTLVPSECMALKTQVFRLEGNDTKEKFSAIYYGPSKGEQVPLILMLHGGPHLSFACQHVIDTSFFALLGFGILMVNYRGSLGELESTLKTLPGKIGKQDIDDIRKATSVAFKALPFLSRSNVCLYGGSYGGFLATLLTGLFPGEYSAVATRAPVIDVASMCVASDIPDWCTMQSGIGKWNGDGHGSVHNKLEALIVMRMISPLYQVNSVKTPTLILIGSQDKRVPPSQGLLYYRCLKAMNVKTRLLMYDDSHSLFKVPIEMDYLINAVLWFIDNMKRDMKSG